MPNTLFAVSKAMRQARYYRKEGSSDCNLFRPGLDWVHEVLKTHRHEYERWPQAWAKALIMIVNTANLMIVEHPKTYAKLQPGVEYAINYMEQRCRDTRKKWEKDNPVLLQVEMAGYRERGKKCDQ